jgi:hypothetical protein
MRLHPLRTYSLPDLADHVIHFTGRTGPRINVDEAIEKLAPSQRLLNILLEQRIRAFTTFRAGAPVVALTESTKAAVTTLIAQERYEPCGVGFSKQFAFEKGGGPALYVRGDEWLEAAEALSSPLRQRLVLFWPGAEAESGELLDDHLRTESQWLHEREWRVPGDLPFSWSDVKFLLVPNTSWQTFYASWIESSYGEEYALWFSSIPAVVMDSRGQVIHDGTSIWA